MCKELAEIAKSQLDNEEFVRVQELAGIKKSREELEEKWGVQTTVSPSEKGKYEGKTKAELLKSYNALKKSGPHHKGSKEYGRMRELAFAIRAKGDWGKVKDE
jgi:hypothetical protein